MTSTPPAQLGLIHPRASPTKGALDMSPAKRQNLYTIVATVGWTVALVCGAAGSVEGNLAALFWALIAALVASLATNQILCQQSMSAERVCVERLVEGLIATARDRADKEDRVSHLHR